MIKKSGFAPGKYLNIKTSKIRKIVKSLYLLVFYIFTYLRSGFDPGKINLHQKYPTHPPFDTHILYTLFQ